MNQRPPRQWVGLPHAFLAASFWGNTLPSGHAAGNLLRGPISWQKLRKEKFGCLPPARALTVARELDDLQHKNNHQPSGRLAQERFLPGMLSMRGFAHLAFGTTVSTHLRHTCQPKYPLSLFPYADLDPISRQSADNLVLFILHTYRFAMNPRVTFCTNTIQQSLLSISHVYLLLARIFFSVNKINAHLSDIIF